MNIINVNIAIYVLTHPTIIVMCLPACIDILRGKLLVVFFLQANI